VIAAAKAEERELSVIGNHHGQTQALAMRRKNEIVDDTQQEKSKQKPKTTLLSKRKNKQTNKQTSKRTNKQKNTKKQTQNQKKEHKKKIEKKAKKKQKKTPHIDLLCLRVPLSLCILLRRRVRSSRVLLLVARGIDIFRSCTISVLLLFSFSFSFSDCETLVDGAVA
jgi:hypothetical protein